MDRITLHKLLWIAALVPQLSVSQSFDLSEPILPDLKRIQQLRSSSSQQGSALSLSRKVVQTSAASAGGDQDAAGIGTLMIETDLLKQVPTLGLRGEIGVMGELPATQQSVRTLTIDSQVYELSLVDRVLDPKFGIHHVTARVTNVPGSYARFSIGADGKIVGTIQTPRLTYRIVPSALPGIQQVFRYASLGRGEPAKFRRALQSEQSTNTALQLELRHIEVERLADIQPETVLRSARGGSFHIRGGQLGRIGSGQVTHAELIRVLRRHNQLNFAPNSLDVRIKAINDWRGGRRLEFEQMIAGVPVWQRNWIQIADDGRILEISTQFVDPARAEALPLVSRSEAARLASRAVEDKFRAVMGELELLNAGQLYYHAVAAQTHLLPQYVFDFDTKTDGYWRVVVNAHTGESAVFDPAQYAAGFRVCRDNSATLHPVNCTSAGSDIIWQRPVDTATMNCPYRNPRGDSVCRDNEPEASQIGTRTAIDTFEVVGQTNPALCCAKIGGSDRTIDVIYQTSGATSSGARYYSGPDAIATPVGDASLQSIETVWHEIGHHVFHQYNPQISDLYNQPGEVFASSFIEAYADLVHAAIAATSPGTAVHTYGDPWILGDGIYGGTDRNLKDTSLDFSRLNLNLTNHERGQAITSFFYQVQQASSISNARLMELLLQVADVLRDFDGNGLDLIDMKGALLQSVRSNETALRDAINSKFDAMYAPLPGDGSGPLPIGVPAPAGSPPPPFPVTAVFTGCTPWNGGYLSTWRVDWPAVSGASHYVGYLKFRFATYIQDSATTTGLQLFASTNAPAWVMVASCNSSGCGHTSVQAPIDHQSICQNF